MSSSQSSERRIPDSPCMRAVGLLIRVMRRHHACVERRIGDLSIHHGQHRMLMKLACRQGDIPSQKELAEIMGISPAAVTATLKKLEREEYISRSMTDEDNRKNEIRIKLFNARRNQLGPLHANDVEPYSVGPRTFTGEKQWVDGEWSGYLKDKYCFVRFGFDHE